MEARPERRGAGRPSNGEFLNLFLTKAAPEFRRGGHALHGGYLIPDHASDGGSRSKKSPRITRMINSKNCHTTFCTFLILSFIRVIHGDYFDFNRHLRIASASSSLSCWSRRFNSANWADGASCNNRWNVNGGAKLVTPPCTTSAR